MGVYPYKPFSLHLQAGTDICKGIFFINIIVLSVYVSNPGSSPGLGKSPGKGKGYPVQYSGLQNSLDCIVHVVAKSQTGLSKKEKKSLYTDYIFHQIHQRIITCDCI